MAKFPEQPWVATLRHVSPALKTYRKGTLVWRIHFAAGHYPMRWNQFRYYGPPPVALNTTCQQTTDKARRWNEEYCTWRKNGQRAVSASYDRTLKVWDLKTGIELLTLRGHISGVNSVSAISDRHVISASHDTTLKIWNIETVQTVRTLQGHKADVKAVAITPEAKHAWWLRQSLNIFSLKIRCLKTSPNKLSP